mgnify:CR=1 FL=1
MSSNHTILFAIVGILAFVDRLPGAVVVDAQVLLPGGRSSIEDLELVGHMGGCAGLLEVKGLTLVNGFIGQVSNRAPESIDPGPLSTAFQTARTVVIDGGDGDGDVILYQITQAPTHGILAGAGPAFTYTPVSPLAVSIIDVFEDGI